MPQDEGYEVGQALESGGDAQRKNKFTEFLKKPENVATAIVFGLALTQPRGNLSRGQALARRGIGAVQLRGGLERGIQDRRIEQQERDRAQSNEQRRVNAAEAGVAAQQEATASRERIAGRQIASQENLSADELEVQRGIQELLTQQRSDEMRMRLIDSFTQQYMNANQVNEAFMNLPMNEKLRLASNWAIVQSQLALEQMDLATVTIGGRQYVDVPDITDAPSSTPTPTTTPRTPTAATETQEEEVPLLERPILRALTGSEDIPQPSREFSFGRASPLVQKMQEERAVAIEDAKASFELGIPLEPSTRAALEDVPLRILRENGFTREQIAIILRGE